MSTPSGGTQDHTKLPAHQQRSHWAECQLCLRKLSLGAELLGQTTLPVMRRNLHWWGQRCLANLEGTQKQQLHHQLSIVINYHPYNQSSSICQSSSYTGWWYTYPSEKYEFVSWGYDIPNWMESHKIPWFQQQQPVMDLCWVMLINKY